MTDARIQQIEAMLQQYPALAGSVRVAAQQSLDRLRKAGQTPESRALHKERKLALRIDAATMILDANYRRALKYCLTVLHDHTAVSEVLAGSEWTETDLLAAPAAVVALAANKGSLLTVLAAFKARHLRDGATILVDAYWHGQKTAARELGVPEARTAPLNRRVDALVKIHQTVSARLPDDLTTQVADALEADASERAQALAIRDRFKANHHRIALAAVYLVWHAYNEGYAEMGHATGTDMYWVSMDDPQVCTASQAALGCQELEEGSPYNARHPLPTVPQGQDTTCKNGCRCWLTFKKGEKFVPMEEVTDVPIE